MSTYANDIAGIGRDDASLLVQMQSRSMNTDSIVTVSTNTLPDSGEFLLWGNDNTATTETAVGTPTYIDQRLARTWKVDETGDLGPVYGTV